MTGVTRALAAAGRLTSFGEIVPWVTSFGEIVPWVTSFGEIVPWVTALVSLTVLVTADCWQIRRPRSVGGE